MRFLTTPLIALAVFLAAVASPVIAQPASTATPSASLDLSCSGSVHSQAVSLWEHSLRSYFTKQIADGLNKEGDVYVLYNTQEELQPFVEMTRRCKDRQQIAELVAVLAPVFSSLRPLPDAPATLGWICTGGHTCTPANHLLGKEVQLCSAQFLGLIGALATDIVEVIPAAQRTETEKAFVANTATAIATQVDNWFSPTYFNGVNARLRMTPADAKDGLSIYFFEDRDLWFLTSLADLAELHQAGVVLNSEGLKAFKSMQAKRAQIGSLFNLFLARTVVANTSNGPRAEIDRGYERNYGDSKYAAYSAAVSPVLCQKNTLGLMQKTFRVENKASYIDPNLGWDISHARRLVPALDTFTRNQSNLATVFGYRYPSFDPARLQRAFANQIVDVIWNKDEHYPLFSNFWDGSNGWYRAGYDNGTGSCRPGEAPYSLAWSFPTGSYPQWGALNSTIRALNLQLYALFNSTDPKAQEFVSKYYPSLKDPGTPNSSQGSTHDIWSLAFLSSMTGT